MTAQIGAALLYFTLLITIGFLAKKRDTSAKDFLIGDRKLNFWLTAFAAHASDASSWLFLGLPAMIFSRGLFSSWMAIGLVVFMFLNWQFIAPKVRIATEKYSSITFSSFFESRFADTSGSLRILTALMQLVFYTIYISAGVVGMGILLQSILGISYMWSTLVGLCLIVPYLFAGGYLTLAWTDLFQALLLLLAIVLVPIWSFQGWGSIQNALVSNDLSATLFPDFSGSTLLAIAFALMSWGLGYFGQPHIVTKFMGISHPEEMPKAKYVGMSWQLLTFTGAVFIGLEGVSYFQNTSINPQTIFVKLADLSFHPFIAGLMLCGVLAATISTINSQILVLASGLSEDFYKRIWRKNASSKEELLVSRIFIIITALVGFFIAITTHSTIYELVFYAWSGLGASFGPVMIAALFLKHVNKYGAFAGIIVGGILAAVWPLFNDTIPPLPIAFFFSLLAIWGISKLTTPREE